MRSVRRSWWSILPTTCDTKAMYVSLPRDVSASSSRMPMRTKSSASVDATRSQSCESMPVQKSATTSAMELNLQEQMLHGPGDDELLPRLDHEGANARSVCRHVGVDRVRIVAIGVDSGTEK